MIILENVTKTYGTGATALDDINLTIEPGEFVFLTGPSGSGKSTLLRMLTREVLPSSGMIKVGEFEVTKLPNSKVPHLRRKIGVVFQDLKLLMDRTIYENIILPLEMSNVHHKDADQRVLKILEEVGIADHKDKYPVQLSGGELQRAAIARALIFNPEILLADEPTGNLDTATSWEIVKLLQDINKAGTTILMATHNTDIVNSLLKRVIALEKGMLAKDSKGKGTEETKEAKESKAEKKDEEEKKKEKEEEKTESHAAGKKKEDAEPDSAKSKEEPKESKGDGK